MHDAAITCVHKLSQARLSSFMPTSTAMSLGLALQSNLSIEVGMSDDSVAWPTG